LIVFQMMTWDILNDLRQDYTLLLEFPVGAPIIVYFIPRSVSKLTSVYDSLVEFSPCTNLAYSPLSS